MWFVINKCQYPSVNDVLKGIQIEASEHLLSESGLKENSKEFGEAQGNILRTWTRLFEIIDVKDRDAPIG